MRTITIQIGNSDDKLSQARWAEYVAGMRRLVLLYCGTIHFFGAPSNYEMWQNAAWVFTCPDQNISSVKAKVARLRAEFHQDSVAWTEGETQFI
jgi:hypothetical protein